MHLEKTVIEGDQKRSWGGLIAGAIVAGAGLWFSRDLAMAGHVLEGTVFGGGTIVVLVGTFVYGTERRRAERESKQRAMHGNEIVTQATAATFAHARSGSPSGRLARAITALAR